jgi:hypothetical protein
VADLSSTGNVFSATATGKIHRIRAVQAVPSLATGWAAATMAALFVTLALTMRHNLRAKDRCV